MRERIKEALVVNVFFVITIMIFGPYEIYIANCNDFMFTFLDFWWIPVVSSILYLIVIIFVLSILPKKIAVIYNYAVFLFTLCCYIQTMFLNGKMEVLTGGNIDFSAKLKLFNISIWGIICVAFIFFKLYRSKTCDKCMKYISGAIILMQMVALVSLLFSTDVLSQKKEGYLTTENMFDLSLEESNVVVFILDTFDGTFMDDILEEEPSYLDKFQDFTYYVNATGTHSRTYPSITYLLTEEKCYFDKKPREYVDNAFEKSNYFSKMISEGVDIGLYTYSDYIGNSVQKNVTNYMSSKRSILISEVQKSLLKMILYRDLPYAFKEMFYYEVDDINYRVDKGVGAYKTGDDEWFYEQLVGRQIQNSMQIPTFRFIIYMLVIRIGVQSHIMVRGV